MTPTRLHGVVDQQATPWIFLFYVFVDRVSRYNYMANDQLDAQFFFLICLFQFPTCSEQPRAQENQLYQYNAWHMSLCVGDRLVCRSGPKLHTRRSPTQWHIPHVLLIQLILLMMSTRLLGICRELKYTYKKKELCVQLVIYHRIFLCSRLLL
jgi:hypothetical protein